MKQSKVINKAETPSLIQQNTEKQITTPLVEKVEDKTNSTLHPNLAEIPKVKAAETPKSPQQNTLLDPNNTLLDFSFL